MNKFFLIFLPIFLTSVSVHASSEIVAIITDVTGSVDIKRGGSQLHVNLLDNVYSNDSLYLNDGSNVKLVYLESGIEYSYKDKATVNIDVKSPYVMEGALGISKDLRMVQQTGLKPFEKALKQTALVMRDSNNSGLKLINPVNTAVSYNTPIFKWETNLNNIKGYHFYIFDEAGRVIVDEEIDSNSYALTDDVSLRNDIAYSWQVDVLKNGESIQTSKAGFVILSSKLQRLIKSSMPGDDAPFSERLIYGVLLKQLNLVEESEEYWSELIVERPQLKTQLP